MSDAADLDDRIEKVRKELAVLDARVYVTPEVRRRQTELREELGRLATAKEGAAWKRTDDELQ